MTFHKYHKIKQFGDDENKELLSDPEDIIIIEEKIDGANFRFMIKDGVMIFGSRNNIICEGDAELDKNYKSWKRCVEYVKEKIRRLEIMHVEGAIFYGECCIRHSMGYNWETMPPFLGFDIYSLKEKRFLDWDEKQFIFEKNLGLPLVPLVKKCKAKDIKKIDEKLVPKTLYPSPSAKDLLAEGVVIKNYGKQIFAKVVREAFKEVNREAFGNNKKFVKDDSERIVAVYATNARIDKCAFKLLESGEKLGMELMHKLPKMVLEDIYEENWKEICFSNFSVNFKSIKKQISKRCFIVLQQMIANNAINQEKKK